MVEKGRKGCGAQVAAIAKGYKGDAVLLDLYVVETRTWIVAGGARHGRV